jgi:hypothetical protein
VYVIVVFNVNIFKNQLKTKTFGQNFFYFPDGCTSTMEISKEKLIEEGGANLVLTEFQTKGRGTYNRNWESPSQGNLYFTIGLVVAEDINSPEILNKELHHLRMCASL